MVPVTTEPVWQEVRVGNITTAAFLCSLSLSFVPALSLFHSLAALPAWPEPRELATSLRKASGGRPCWSRGLNFFPKARLRRWALGMACREGSSLERLGGWRVYRPAMLKVAGMAQGPRPAMDPGLGIAVAAEEEEEDEEDGERGRRAGEGWWMGLLMAVRIERWWARLFS